MRYAILPNDRPRGAVSVRLLIRVGATNGAPGEAHYLEHMAFMGSRGVPEGARARLARRERLREGTGFNAHTGDYRHLLTGSTSHGRTGRSSGGSCSCCARWPAS